jgi:hypothetical protein
MENWSCPIGQDSCIAKAKTKADWLHKSEISEPDFNHVIKRIDCKYIVCIYIIFTSPIGGANKKGEDLQKIRNNAYSLRQCLIIKLYKPETEIMSFKGNRHVQIANNP